MLTDEVLSRAQKSDPAALATVYQALAGQVVGYLAGKGVEDPEGVAQDVFLTVFSRLGEVDGGATGLRRFTFSVAHARMVDDVRRRARAPRIDEYRPETDDRTTPSALDAVLERLGSGHLAGVLEQLGEDQRECVLLRVVAGLSLEETAAVMGKSVGSIKQLQRRGLLAMKKSLEEVGVHG
jgi:RNA polymerase sigma factor (sigma-70 family)